MRTKVEQKSTHQGSKRSHEVSVPSSIYSAINRKRVLLEEIEDIKLQLGTAATRAHKIKNIAVWQSGAKTALRVKLREYRFLQNWIKDQRRVSVLTKAAVPLKPDDPNSYVRAGYDLIRRLHEEGIELNEEEKTILEEMQLYLQGIPAAETE